MESVLVYEKVEKEESEELEDLDIWKEEWLKLLERLNRDGKYVWGPILLGGTIVGVRKIRALYAF